MKLIISIIFLLSFNLKAEDNQLLFCSHLSHYKIENNTECIKEKMSKKELKVILTKYEYSLRIINSLMPFGFNFIGEDK